MKEKLAEYCLDGFFVNETERVMHGTRNGIIILIEMFHVSLSKEISHRVMAPLDFLHSERKEEFLSKLQELEQRYEYVRYVGNISGNNIAVVIDGDKAQTKVRLEYVIHELTTICNEYDISSQCEVCDSNQGLEYICVDHDKKLMCSACSARITNSVNSIQTKKDIFILGLIGAVFGALLGSVLWIVLDQVGFIAGIAGYAIVFCSVKGYDLFGRTISRKGIVISILVSLLTILFADCFSLGISIYREFSTTYSLTFLDALMSVPYFLTEEEVLKSILINLGIGYLFAIWASASFVKNLWRATNKVTLSVKLEKL